MPMYESGTPNRVVFPLFATTPHETYELTEHSACKEASTVSR